MSMLGVAWQDAASADFADAQMLPFRYGPRCLPFDHFYLSSLLHISLFDIKFKVVVSWSAIARLNWACHSLGNRPHKHKHQHRYDSLHLSSTLEKLAASLLDAKNLHAATSRNTFERICRLGDLRKYLGIYKLEEKKTRHK